MSCRSAAEPQLENRSRAFDDRERVVEDVLVLVDGILLELQGRQLRQEELGKPGRFRQLRARDRVTARSISFDSSSRIRSADTVLISSRSSSIAAHDGRMRC